MKKTIALVLSLLVIGNTTVMAYPNNINDEEVKTTQEVTATQEVDVTGSDVRELSEEELIESMRNYGLTESTIEKLINKLENGQIWDSMNPEFEGATVSERISNTETKYTYPDGSIKISNIESLQEAMDNMNNGRQARIPSQEGITTLSGDSYSTLYRATVVENVLVINYVYFVDYRVSYGSNTAKIENLSRREMSVYGLSGLNESVTSTLVKIDFWFNVKGQVVYYWAEIYSNGRGLGFRGNQ